MQDINLSEINDFFNSTLVPPEMVKLPLTIDHVLVIIPFAVKLIGSKYEPHIKTGIMTAYNILKMFYERITSAKKVIFSGGVDMAREDRMKKYDVIIDNYEHIYKDLSVIIKSKKQPEVITLY